jgi:hypothetical protein
MQNRVLNSLLEFFEGAGHAISTPSGDARGHVRVYVAGQVRSGRNF